MWISCAALFGLFSVSVGAQGKGQAKQFQARDLAGKYRAVCTNPNGTKGEGTVEIEWLQGNEVKFTSIYATKDIGIGTLNGKILSVKYRGKAKTERSGEAQYSLQANGELDGWWHYAGQKKMPEKLTRMKKKKQ